MKHTESQRTRLKQHFDSGKSVTRLTAFIDLGICELSSRIGELEKSGYAVAREMVKVTNRFGEEVKVMKYRKNIFINCNHIWIELKDGTAVCDNCGETVPF